MWEVLSGEISLPVLTLQAQRFSPANRTASLTGGDVKRPTGPHHGNVRPQQGHQLTELPSKEPEHQTVIGTVEF